MGALDLAVIAAYLAAVVAAGAWFSRRQQTTRQYFLGGGRVPWWAVAASIVATETSTITFISVPGIAYARGGDFGFLQIAMGYVVGRIVIARFFVPAYFRGELLTVYQLLESRFGGGVRALAAALFVSMRTVADGIRLLLTAGVLRFVWLAFFPEHDSTTAVVGAAVALGAVMVAFTLLGGIEAVIWIEVAQLALYLAGAAAVAVVLAGRIDGGLAGALETASDHGKLRVFDFAWTLAREHTFLAGVVGGAFLTLSTHGTDQYLVQRYLCTGASRRAAAALIASGAAVLAQFALFLGLGALLFAHHRPFALAGYETGPKAAPFAKADDVLAAFVAGSLPAGVAGLVVAAILAAAMSSSLNAVAATVLSDLVRPIAGRRGDAWELKWSKRLTAAAGAAQVGVAVALLGSAESAVKSALTVASLLNGPVLGVFLVGMLTRRPGAGAALAGMAAGLAAAVAVWARGDVAWPWFTAVGSLTTLAAASVMGALAPSARRARAEEA